MTEAFTQSQNLSSHQKGESKKAMSASPAEFNKLRQNAAHMVLDTRESDEFARSFIPGSLNIAASGSYALLHGLADFGQKLLLICPADREKETINRLAIVGYKNVVATLNGGIKAWRDAGLSLSSVPLISMAEVTDLIHEEIPVYLIDLRKKGTNKAELTGAVPVSLDSIESGLLRIDRSKTYFVVGESRNDAVFMVSVARTRGFTNLIPVNTANRP